MLLLESNLSPCGSQRTSVRKEEESRRASRARKRVLEQRLRKVRLWFRRADKRLHGTFPLPYLSKARHEQYSSATASHSHPSSSSHLCSVINTCGAVPVALRARNPAKKKTGLSYPQDVQQVNVSELFAIPSLRIRSSALRDISSEPAALPTTSVP